MKQLVQLQQHADDFRALNAELIFVFREESKGVDGLKLIKEKHDTNFTLTVDLGKKNTQAYSPGKMEFDNYVIDSGGIIRGVIDGTKTDRAKADELLAVLKQINDTRESR